MRRTLWVPKTISSSTSKVRSIYIILYTGLCVEPTGTVRAKGPWSLLGCQVKRELCVIRNDVGIRVGS